VIPAPVERSVVIATPPPVSTFPMPTPDEMTQLIDAVGRRFPALLDTQGPAFEETRHERRAQWLKQFEGAFLAIPPTSLMAVSGQEKGATWAPSFAECE
jgi:hypothetical protein